jgi:hypothetical protein
VPLRYGRMLVSPFTFYRGAAAVMAADLAGTPRSGLPAQTAEDLEVDDADARTDKGAAEWDEMYARFVHRPPPRFVMKVKRRADAKLM